MYYPDPMISFERLHIMNKRALPAEILIYKHAIQLHRLYNTEQMTTKWSHLNFNQILSSRQNVLMALKSNKSKVGINPMANRLSILNSKIPLEWLRFNHDSFKIKCKAIFLNL